VCHTLFFDSDIWNEIFGRSNLYLISNSRRVLDVVFFLLGDSLGSKFFMCQRFGTLCSILIGGVSSLLKPPMKMELTERTETSSRKIHSPETQG
jgi:hypothetical protein